MQAKYFDPSMGPLMRKAIEYTFKRLPKLSMYVTNGSWKIDNNGCKACGIEPREWLEDAIRRIPEYENGRSDVTHLLPGNWKPHSSDSNQR